MFPNETASATGVWTLAAAAPATGVMLPQEPFCSDSDEFLFDAVSFVPSKANSEEKKNRFRENVKAVRNKMKGHANSGKVISF